MAPLGSRLGRPFGLRQDRKPFSYKLSLTARHLLLATVAFAAVAVLIYLAIGTYIALKLTAPEPMTARGTPTLYSLTYESPQIKTRDGVDLAGWFIPRSDSARAIVMVHGLWTCRSCELDGRYLELANHLHDAGYNILMIDLRKHGASQGEHVTFGQNERWDILAAVEWLGRRGYSKTGVLGVSLGGASSALAAAEPGQGEQIKALVLDSVFADWVETLGRSFTLETGLPSQLLPGAILMMRVLLGVDLYRIRPVDKLPRIKARVMLIYGGQDKYLSAAQMEAMEKARPDAEMWFVPDAGHTRSYNLHEEEYVRRVSAFLDRALK